MLLRTKLTKTLIVLGSGFPCVWSRLWWLSGSFSILHILEAGTAASVSLSLLICPLLSLGFIFLVGGCLMSRCSLGVTGLCHQNESSCAVRISVSHTGRRVWIQCAALTPASSFLLLQLLGGGSWGLEEWGSCHFQVELDWVPNSQSWPAPLLATDSLLGGEPTNRISPQ